MPRTSADAAEPAKSDRIPITIDAKMGQVAFSAEVADAPAERQRGLMFRESLGDSEGMLFLFPEQEQLSFWMKNTLIPLDMIFIRADKTILGVVSRAAPRTETSRFVLGDSQFVLEIAGGLAAKHGIEAGQAVHFYAPIPER